MSEEVNEMVGDLIQQLQTSNKKALKVQRVVDPATRENLEDYVIKQSSSLVEDTLEVVDIVKDYMISAPESKDVSSLAELINAATNAVETLNKIVLSTKKNETIIKVKDMDIAAKKDLQETDINSTLKLTREEALKNLLKNIKPIEVDIIEDVKSLKED